MTERKPRPITELSANELAANIINYRKAGLTTGGNYTLAELLLEQRRRTPSEFPHVALARWIVEHAKTTPDHHVTYLEIWQAFTSDLPWKANDSRRKVGNSLGRVIEYCVRHDLPILSVLVVPGGTRRLTPAAVQNIFNECRELGVNTGSDAAAFISREETRALEFLASDLPDDDDPIAA